MAYIAVGATAGGPFTTIVCPDGGEFAKADDLHRIVGGALGNDAVQTQALANYAAVAHGKFITGNGAGASYTPTGAPIVIGGTGFGGVVGAPLTAPPADPITMDAPVVVTEGLTVNSADVTGDLDVGGHLEASDIRLTAADPAPDADVGANGLYFAANIPKAWGLFTVVGGDIELLAGINVASLAIVGVGAEVEVTLARPMATASKYAVTFGTETIDFLPWVNSAKTEASFRIGALRISNNTPRNFANDPGGIIIAFHVLGNQ